MKASAILAIVAVGLGVAFPTSVGINKIRNPALKPPNTVLLPMHETLKKDEGILDDEVEDLDDGTLHDNEEEELYEIRI